MRHHVSAVGVDRYDQERDLRYCSADAELFARTIGSVTGAEPVVLTTGATLSPGIRDLMALAERLEGMECTAEDVVVVYFAGHGYSKNGKDYLLGSDSRVAAPESMLSTSRLVTAMRATGAGHAVLIMDACRAGDGDGARQLFGEGTRDASNKLGVTTFFGCAPGESCQETLFEDGEGHGIYTKALCDQLLAKRALVVTRDDEDLRQRVQAFTRRFGLLKQSPQIVTRIALASQDIITGRHVQLIEKPRRMLVVAGPPHAGKSTVGPRLSEITGYQHVEMSSQAYARYTVARSEGSFRGSIQEYMDREVWAGGHYDRIARDLLDSSPHISELLVTGPRRPEEIETLLSAGFTIELVYLYTDSRTRYDRYMRNVDQTGGYENALTLTGFVKRDLQENSWGLPKIGLMQDARIVENDNAKVDRAVEAIVGRLRRRNWLAGRG